MTALDLIRGRALDRAEIERLVADLIDVLDVLDGDIDLEDCGDAELSLGWTIHGGLGAYDGNPFLDEFEDVGQLVANGAL